MFRYCHDVMEVWAPTKNILTYSYNCFFQIVILYLFNICFFLSLFFFVFQININSNWYFHSILGFSFNFSFISTLYPMYTSVCFFFFSFQIMCFLCQSLCLIFFKIYVFFSFFLYYNISVLYANHPCNNPPPFFHNFPPSHNEVLYTTSTLFLVPHWHFEYETFHCISHH